MLANISVFLVLVDKPFYDFYPMTNPVYMRLFFPLVAVRNTKFAILFYFSGEPGVTAANQANVSIQVCVN